MSRTERLFALLQLLRQHRYPVSGKLLAEKLDISLRSLYRDIQSLQQLGANISGEAGVGYQLKPDFLLPPINFSSDEIEAVTLGIQWVAQQQDPSLEIAAKSALAKIGAILPSSQRYLLENTTIRAITHPKTKFKQDSRPIRQAIRQNRKLQLHYQDAQDNKSTRIIWPFALGFFTDTCLIAAWCELRNEFRHFRLDRCLAMQVLEQPYPTSRHALFKQWQQHEGINLNNSLS